MVDDRFYGLASQRIQPQNGSQIRSRKHAGGRTQLSLEKDAPISRAVDRAGAHSLSPNPGRTPSPICPDLIYDRHRHGMWRTPRYDRRSRTFALCPGKRWSRAAEFSERCPVTLKPQAEPVVALARLVNHSQNVLSRAFWGWAWTSQAQATKACWRFGKVFDGK
jgi:hypothetical protein